MCFILLDKINAGIPMIPMAHLDIRKNFFTVRVIDE